MFIHQREPEAAWQAACARIAPRAERVNWLLIHWEPGELWSAVQRWVIREMVPRLDTINPLQLSAYHGPHPRTIGYWKDGRWYSESIVSKRQYDLFQEYTCHSRVVWVVQGPDGGHPRAYTHAEEQAAMARGLPTEPPLLGSLPYAEPNQRTWSRLAELDKLRKWHQRFTIGWDQRQMTQTAAGLYVMQDARADYEAWGEKMRAWFDDGIREALDGVSKTDWAKVADLAPVPQRSLTDAERAALDNQFLHSTALGADEE